MENTGAARRNRMRTALKEDVPLYPHVCVVHCHSGRLMIQISWGKKREVTIMGNRMTIVTGNKTNIYSVYEGKVDTGWFETTEENIEIIK